METIKIVSNDLAILEKAKQVESLAEQLSKAVQELGQMQLSIQIEPQSEQAT